jgi:hypothetical protein
MTHPNAETFLLEECLKAAYRTITLGRELGFVGLDEKIVCTMSVVPVNSGVDDLLGMHVADYFTVARFQAAGVDPKFRLNRILKSCLGERNLQRRLIRIQDILEYGAKRFERRKNVGEKTCSIIRTIFEHDGITGF